MYIIIIQRENDGSIMSVNRSYDGCGMELIGLNITTINGLNANIGILKSAFEDQPQLEAISQDGIKYKVQKIFMSN